MHGSLGEKEGAFALRAFVGRWGGGCEAGGDECGVGGGDVVHLETKVMQAGAVLREPGLERVIGRERLDELEVGVAKVEVREADGAAVDDFAAHDGEAELVAPEFQRVFG